MEGFDLVGIVPVQEELLQGFNCCIYKYASKMPFFCSSLLLLVAVCWQLWLKCCGNLQPRY